MARQSKSSVPFGMPSCFWTAGSISCSPCLLRVSTIWPSSLLLTVSGNNEIGSAHPDRGGIPGNGVPGGRRRGVGGHGRAAICRKRCSGSACQYHRHGRSAGGLDTDVWTHLRRASESGGFPGGRNGRWFGLVSDASLHGRTDSRRSLWHASSSPHVWASAGIAVPPYSWRTSAILERVYCDFRTFVCDLGMFEVSPERGALCGRELHHCRLLVYVLDVLRQPRGIDRQMLERHVRRDSARRCSAIRGGAICRRNRGNHFVSLACSRLAVGS